MNKTITDHRITFKAKGIYAYLKEAKNVRHSAEYLAGVSKDGRESVLTGLRELERAGFLQRQRNNDGTVNYRLL